MGEGVIKSVGKRKSSLLVGRLPLLACHICSCSEILNGLAQNAYETENQQHINVVV